MTKLHARATFKGDTQCLLVDGVSDHAPVKVVLAPRLPLPCDKRPINNVVCRSRVFAELRAKYIERIDLDFISCQLRGGGRHAS